MILDISAHPLQDIFDKIDHIFADRNLRNFHFFISPQKPSGLGHFLFLCYAFETRRKSDQPGEDLDYYAFVKRKGS
jgi:hypothetical protein